MTESSSPPVIRVLVADGCRHARRRVRDALNGLGHRQVYEAADGAEAVGLLEAASPTLVVIDWDLAVVGAPELIMMAKGAGRPAPPVIVTMAEPRRPAVERAVGAGIAGIVVKPFSAGLIRSRLAAATAA